MKAIRFVCGGLLGIVIILSVVFGATTHNKKIKDTPKYQGIISLWQVDSFEGGVGSRKQFLMREAVAFEKLNSGVLVMVSSQTPESVKQKVEQGVYPDMISFGLGTEIDNLNLLDCDKNFRAGMLGDKQYISSWCKGGYFIIENPSAKVNSIIVSKSDYNSPTTALSLIKKEYLSTTILSSKDAYYQFVLGRDRYLLGTQKDILRLSNRGFEYIATPITEYNDMYQLFAITSNNNEKAYYCQQFLNQLLSFETQSKLKEIGMMSPYYETSQDNEFLKEMQKQKEKYTLSAFTSKAEIESLNELSLKAIKGDEESKNKIKNLLL